jgi:hypothetical protein
MPYAEKEVLLLRFDSGAAVHVRLSGAVRVYLIAANMLNVMCPSGVCNSVSIVGKQNRCVVRLRSPSPTYIMFRVLLGLLELERPVVQVNNIRQKTMYCLCGLALVC